MNPFTKLNQKIPRRLILGIMMFFACHFSYYLRSNYSIIQVAMVQSTKTLKGPPVKIAMEKTTIPIGTSITPTPTTEGTTPTTTTTTTVGPIESEFQLKETDEELPDYGPRYDWNQHVQGQLLAAYFYGVVFSSAPGGYLAERIGGTRVVAYGTLIPLMLNALTPLAASFHVAVVFVIRFLMGFFGGAVYPALQAMIARWVPPTEKGLFAWTSQGGPLGAFMVFTLCGFVIDMLGWSAAFYITSGIIFLFWLMWILIVYDTPDVHPTITDEEKNYIASSLGTAVSKEKKKLPFKAMATSVPFMALLFAHFANMWGIYFLSNSGPKYILEVLGINMKEAGALSGAPYIARLLTGLVFAATGDILRKKEILSVGWIRRTFMLSSHCGPAFCLVIATHLGYNHYPAVAMNILALAFNGAACQTNLVNHQDLSPNFAGTLYGTMNTIGSFPGFIVPAIVGAYTQNHNGVEEWRPVFYMSSGIFVLSTITFWIFGSTDVQPWND